MIDVHWKPFPIRIKTELNKTYIFDIIRKKWLLHTPEEWVRQNLIWYLIEELNYPKSVIAVEKKINYNNINKRFDIVIYNKILEPWMLIECKSPSVAISQQVLFQTLTYHAVLHCKYWLMTNGNTTFCAQYEQPNIHWLSEIPNYKE